MVPLPHEAIVLDVESAAETMLKVGFVRERLTQIGTRRCILQSRSGGLACSPLQSYIWGHIHSVACIQ